MGRVVSVYVILPFYLSSTICYNKPLASIELDYSSWRMMTPVCGTKTILRFMTASSRVRWAIIVRDPKTRSHSS